LPRLLGHRAGAEAVRRVVEACCALGVPALTLYAFSWENRDRPAEEVQELMGLLEEFLAGEAERLHANQIRLQAMGRLHTLPDGVRARLAQLRGATAPYRRMTLTLALSYGGRQELVDAMQTLARQVRRGTLAPEQIDEAAIGRALYLPELPEPDLLIRTSGEQRLSNFLLWQISYAELYVTPTLWPDFTAEDLQEAIAAYHQRERRFGKVTASPTTVESR